MINNEITEIMDTEEKARAYDEALERARKYNIDGAHACQGTVVKLIFPVLKESEDERIRKWILEKVKDRIKKLDMESCISEEWSGFYYAIDSVLEVIDSLRQDQPDFPTTDEQIKEFLATHPKIEVPEKYKNPDWLFKKQEQPDNKEEQPQIDWESEIEKYWITAGWSINISLDKFKVIARYFIGLALNAKKEE